MAIMNVHGKAYTPEGQLQHLSWMLLEPLMIVWEKKELWLEEDTTSLSIFVFWIDVYTFG